MCYHIILKYKHKRHDRLTQVGWSACTRKHSGLLPVISYASHWLRLCLKSRTSISTLTWLPTLCTYQNSAQNLTKWFCPKSNTAALHLFINYNHQPLFGPFLPLSLRSQYISPMSVRSVQCSTLNVSTVLSTPTVKSKGTVVFHTVSVNTPMHSK